MRLRALSVDDLAVDVLPGLGPDGPTHGNERDARSNCVAISSRTIPVHGRRTRLTSSCPCTERSSGSS